MLENETRHLLVDHFQDSIALSTSIGSSSISSMMGALAGGMDLSAGYSRGMQTENSFDFHKRT